MINEKFMNRIMENFISGVNNKKQENEKKNEKKKENKVENKKNVTKREIKCLNCQKEKEEKDSHI